MSVGLENFLRLPGHAQSLRHEYLNAKPWPHIVVEGIFPEELLDSVAAECAGLEQARLIRSNDDRLIKQEASEGLGPATTALADRSVVPSVVSAVPDRRLSPAVEATAYFVVSEALANVAKYSTATQASVGADCRGSTLHVEVGDNGVGGADASRGSGIHGLEDRVAAIGGRVTIDSPPGQGTLVVAEIPIP